MLHWVRLRLPDRDPTLRITTSYCVRVWGGGVGEGCSVYGNGMGSLAVDCLLLVNTSVSNVLLSQ